MIAGPSPLTKAGRPRRRAGSAVDDVFKTIFSRMVTPVWIFDIDHSRIVWANAEACRAWRADSLEALLARDFASDMSVTVATRLQQYKQDFERSGATFSEVWTHYPQGVPSTMRVTYSGITLPDGRTAMLCEGGGAFKETPDKLRSAEALLHTSVMITLSDRGGQVLYSNPAAKAIEPEGGSGVNDRFADSADLERMRDQLAETGEAHLVALMRTVVGLRWHEITARHCSDPATGIPACLTSEVDVTEVKTLEAQARHDAGHDPLTGLPNRVYVQTVFERRLGELLQAKRRAAALFIDLDRFKTVNDSLGHSKGDLLLIEIANRLTTILAGRAEVARLGGDEFLVLLEIGDDDAPIQQLVDTLLDAMQQPIPIGEHQLRLTSSIGIAIAPQDGRDIPSMMKNADAAMYEAKRHGKNRESYYVPRMSQDALDRMNLEIELQNSFEQEGLQLYYQPRISMRTGRIVSAEVLLRWPHARSGQIPPSTFIPLAEDNGSIVQIGSWVLHKAAQQQMRWRSEGLPIRLSVNLSPRQFGDGNLVQVARDALQLSGARAADIELEITERLLLDEQPYVQGTLRQLKDLGFGISLDDFGTGYSNLAQLQRHPIDCLKIDRSFISNLDEHGPITELVIQMCQRLKLRIVAEGVETVEQHRWLTERGCDEYQGYYFSSPVPATQFRRMIEMDCGGRIEPPRRAEATSSAA